jgi:hypothetical protein
MFSLSAQVSLDLEENTTLATITCSWSFVALWMILRRHEMKVLFLPSGRPFNLAMELFGANVCYAADKTGHALGGRKTVYTASCLSSLTLKCLFVIFHASDRRLGCPIRPRHGTILVYVPVHTQSTKRPHRYRTEQVYPLKSHSLHCFIDHSCNCKCLGNAMEVGFKGSNPSTTDVHRRAHHRSTMTRMFATTSLLALSCHVLVASFVVLPKRRTTTSTTRRRPQEVVERAPLSPSPDRSVALAFDPSAIIRGVQSSRYSTPADDEIMDEPEEQLSTDSSLVGSSSLDDDYEDGEDDDDKVDDADDNDIEPLLTDERKANLFQFLLRDLQIEGVPLLGIDADQVQTLQAAIWTTMAGLLATAVGGGGGGGEEESASAASSDDVVAPKTAETTPEQQESTTGTSSSSKVCLVFEDIPIDALQDFVQDFQSVQNDQLVQQHLPELLAFRIALVGNGVGPAITVSVKIDDAVQDNFKDHVNPLAIIDKTYAGDGVIQATEAFVKRVVQNSDDAIGMMQPAYRYCGFVDACHALSAFWNCLCELQAKPDLPSIMLSFPMDFDPALTMLMNRSLCLYRGNDVLELAHYGPSYDRAAVDPSDQPAFGHLPPVEWLVPVMAQYANNETLPDPRPDVLASIANFQRRSPVAAVLIKRVELMNKEAKDNPLAASSDLTLANGSTVSAFGLPLLAKSIQRLATIGTDQLEANLDQEIAMIM